MSITQHYKIERPKNEFFDDTLSRHNRSLNKKFKQFARGFGALRSIDVDSFSLYSKACFCLPGNLEARKYLDRSLKAGYTYSKLAVESDLKIRFEIEENSVVLNSGFENQFLQILSYWDRDVQKALVLRNHAALEYFLKLDPRVNFREGYTVNGNALISLAFVYKALFSKRRYLGSLFSLAKRAFGSNEVSYTVKPLYPQIELIEKLLSCASEDEYNETLKKALLQHQSYFAQNDPDHWAGVTAFPLTAIAVLAYDNWGYKVTVENEYIPQWIVEDNGGNEPWNIGEKSLDLPPSASINFTSVDDQLNYLKDVNLDAQLEHIDYYIDHMFLGDEPLQAMEAMYPCLWHIFLNKIPYQFGESGDGIQQYILDNITPIAKELDDLRGTVEYVKL